MLEFALVNWWAVLAAALAQLAVGGLWNGVLFPRQFFATHEVEDNPKPSGGQAIIMVALTVVNSYILALLFAGFGVDSIGSGLKLIILLWLALLLPFIVGTAFATGRKQVIPYELGHTFLGMIVAGIILALWR